MFLSTDPMMDVYQNITSTTVFLHTYVASVRALCHVQVMPPTQLEDPKRTDLQPDGNLPGGPVYMQCIRLNDCNYIALYTCFFYIPHSFDCKPTIVFLLWIVCFSSGSV